MRILVEQREVILHGLANVFADDLGIFPSPFRVEVGIADHVERRLLAQIGLFFFHGLRVSRGKQHQAGKRKSHQSRTESSHRKVSKSRVEGSPVSQNPYCYMGTFAGYGTAGRKVAGSAWIATEALSSPG